MRIVGRVRFLDERGQVVCRSRNMAMSFVTEAFAKAYKGETGKVGDVSIQPLSMALGSGSTPVTSTATAIDSELMRKAFSSAGGSVSRAGSKVLFRITLYPGEAVGAVRVVGLFGPDAGTGSASTGSLVIGGAPAADNAITVRLDGKSTSTYYVQSGHSTSQTAAALSAHLAADDLVLPFYTLSVSGSTINFLSRGKGTVYNKVMTTLVTGSVTALASGIAGGTTPGGQLLHAANVELDKLPGETRLAEWSVEIKS